MLQGSPPRRVRRVARGRSLTRAASYLRPARQPSLKAREPGTRLPSNFKTLGLFSRSSLQLN